MSCTTGSVVRIKGTEVSQVGPVQCLSAERDKGIRQIAAVSFRKIRLVQNHLNIVDLVDNAFLALDLHGGGRECELTGLVAVGHASGKTALHGHCAHLQFGHSELHVQWVAVSDDEGAGGHRPGQTRGNLIGLGVSSGLGNGGHVHRDGDRLGGELVDHIPLPLDTDGDGLVCTLREHEAALLQELPPHEGDRQVADRSVHLGVDHLAHIHPEDDGNEDGEAHIQPLILFGCLHPPSPPFSRGTERRA